jgi:organic hydroperoxide reductase OsmC/OhrA
MEIEARIDNRRGQHTVTVSTNGREQPVLIPPKTEGQGSAVNGGELLFLALATCYGNDLYREARKRGIEIERVQVEVTGSFGGEGEGSRDVRYKATVEAKASREEILELMRHTDGVAEIQNTLRGGVPVVLASCEARPV